MSMLYRICLATYASAYLEYDYSTLIIFVFSFLFILYNLINLPFIKPVHNYRACFCHLTQFVILLTANY